MNGIKYLADTNCFIYLLDENPSILPFIQDGWAYSYITEIELLSKKTITPAEEQVIKAMLATCFKIEHSQTLSNLTIQIRRKHGVKLPDAIIAASALLINLPLITGDTNFGKIENLNSLVLDV